MKPFERFSNSFGKYEESSSQRYQLFILSFLVNLQPLRYSCSNACYVGPVCRRCGKVPYTFLSKMVLISVVCSFLLQLVINLLKILCTNAAWQRRKLGKILQDWRVIYVQVCPMSLDLNAKYFC